MPFVELRQLFRDSGTQIVVGDDPKLASGRERRQPLDRLLDHCVFAVERQKLLGAPLAAQGPEPRASATGQNYRMKVDLLRHEFSQNLVFLRAEPIRRAFSFQNLNADFLQSRLRLAGCFARNVCFQKFHRPLRTNGK